MGWLFEMPFAQVTSRSRTGRGNKHQECRGDQPRKEPMGNTTTNCAICVHSVEVESGASALFVRFSMVSSMTMMGMIVAVRNQWHKYK